MFAPMLSVPPAPPNPVPKSMTVSALAAPADSAIAAKVISLFLKFRILISFSFLSL
jgi:hypothetical protein